MSAIPRVAGLAHCAWRRRIQGGDGGAKAHLPTAAARCSTNAARPASAPPSSRRGPGALKAADARTACMAACGVGRAFPGQCRQAGGGHRRNGTRMAVFPGRVQDDALLDDVAEAVLQAAENIALEAGCIIRQKLGAATEVKSKEVRCDLVTEVDKECEELITQMVKATFPLHRIVGEETADAGSLALLEVDAFGPTDWVWIVDPIDGTLNFVGGIPMCAVSLGVARGGAMEVAAVYNPFSNELFSARRGEGAYLNGKLISGAEAVPELELEDAAVAVGFPSDGEDRKHVLRAMTQVAPHARTMRGFGSAALHMSYVAAGRLGAFFEVNLKPWDIAAARLIVEEAGGLVTGMDGGPLPLKGGSVLATKGGTELHSRMLSLIQE